MRTFQKTLSTLRRERQISQRQAAAALGVSQALLSHYENGAREPGLAFVCRACDYYGVTADYMLGRSEDPRGGAATLRGLMEQMRDLMERAETALRETGGSQ